MTDFEPATDAPELVDSDDRPIASTAQSRDEKIQKRRKRLLGVVVVAITLAILATGMASWWRVLTAGLMMYVIFRVGFAVIGAFARPVPEAPPPGELRRVRFTYRCTECGAELRMTLANDEAPTPPRHCSGEMELTGTRDDAL